MNKKIFFLAFLLPALFACKDNDPNDGYDGDEDSLIDVVLFMSHPNPDNPSFVPDVFAMLPDGSKTKVLMSRHGYPDLLDLSMPYIGNDGKTLFYIWGASDSGEMYFLDLPSMRITDRYRIGDPVSVSGEFWIVRPIVSPDMKEIYGTNLPYENIIIVLNRETKTMTTLLDDIELEPQSLMMSGDKSSFIFASRDDAARTTINRLDITGRNLQRLITLQENTYVGNSTLIGSIPNTNRYIYAYRYVDNGNQYLRLVRTDLNNSFSTELGTIDHTGITYFSDRLSVSRDGNMLVYSYEDELNGDDVEHIVIRHYENDQLTKELVIPTFSYLYESRPPVFCVISKALFDKLADPEYPFTALPGRAVEP